MIKSGFNHLNVTLFLVYLTIIIIKLVHNGKNSGCRIDFTLISNKNNYFAANVLYDNICFKKQNKISEN